MCIRDSHNIALIKNVEVPFGPGLNILTGETGAGKSIIIDAVNLALGERADRGLIRYGTQRAQVEAAFALPKGCLLYTSPSFPATMPWAWR